jgi:hypothetical protein
MSRKLKHPILAKRQRSRGGVRGHLTRRDRALAEVMAELGVAGMLSSGDGRLRIPFRLDVPRKVRKQAFALASAILGQRGGIARAKKLSAERRREIARQGGVARWSSKPRVIEKRA